MSTRESALAALFTALQGVAGAPTVRRNSPLPEDVPVAGLIVMGDGDPGEPEEMMSPPRDAWRHRVEVGIYVQKGEDAARAAALDALAVAVAAKLATDRSLGGAVQHMDWGPLVPAHDAVEGAASFAAAVISVYLYYETDAGGLA